MYTQQAQIKVNLPFLLKEYLDSKASRFGLPTATYLKHLILKDVENVEYPVYEASDRTIKKAKEAIKNKDKAILVRDVDEFFANL